MNKILIVNKPCGLTTAYVVNKLKKFYNADKAGHSGTLDPLATGVVVIFFGRLTKLIPFVQEQVKAYKVKVLLGIQTDTLDISGSIEAVSKITDIRLDKLNLILKSFQGEYRYLPPRYSAIKIEGMSAYKYARKGKEVSLPERVSQIYSILVNDIGKYTFELEVRCSKGTYVRSFVCNLTRLSSGVFDIKDSNDYFSILKGNKANFFKIDDIFRTLETNSTFIDLLRECPNHKEVPLLNFLDKSPNDIGIEFEKDIYIVLTIKQSPVGLIHNKFDRCGRYAHSHVKLFY
jgi:tRNA pseudouridine(55) synthase